MDKRAVLIYGASGILMAIPALFVAGGRPVWMVPIFAGLTVLARLTLKAGPSEPRRVLVLILILNSSYWLSHVLWLFRTKTLQRFAATGEDPFVGAVTLWLPIFLAVSLYALVVFFHALAKKREQRIISALGIAGVAFQMFVTLRVILNIVEGV